MKPKYILMFVMDGLTHEQRFPLKKKEEAVMKFKLLLDDPDCWRVKLFSIDSEDDELWYDIGKRIIAEMEGK